MHSLKQNSPSPLYPIVLPMQTRNQQILTPPCGVKFRSREQAILRQPRRTNPMVWCAAILCMLFTLLIIFLGIATLIIFLAIQPKSPVFDTPGASLTAVYFNSPNLINVDTTLLAKFSNPNRKLNVRFEYLHIELYLSESLIATQVLQPFSQSPGEARLMSVHLLSRLVYLPPNLVMELQKQALRNRVVYNMKATFRVKAKLGLLHYSYWLHRECQLEMTSPPNGVLIAHSCRTGR